MYKRQRHAIVCHGLGQKAWEEVSDPVIIDHTDAIVRVDVCLLYTSDAADERSSVDLGGRRIIKKKKKQDMYGGHNIKRQQKKEPDKESQSEKTEDRKLTT